MVSIPTMSHSCTFFFFSLTLFLLIHSIFSEISFLSWTFIAVLDVTYLCLNWVVEDMFLSQKFHQQYCLVSLVLINSRSSMVNNQWNVPMGLGQDTCSSPHLQVEVTTGRRKVFLREKLVLQLPEERANERKQMLSK